MTPADDQQMRTVRAAISDFPFDGYGIDHFPLTERPCPGAGRKPWAVCSWTIPAPEAKGEAA